jgi:hypothetical protein
MEWAYVAYALEQITKQTLTYDLEGPSVGSPTSLQPQPPHPPSRVPAQ